MFFDGSSLCTYWLVVPLCLTALLLDEVFDQRGGADEEQFCSSLLWFYTSLCMCLLSELSVSIHPVYLPTGVRLVIVISDTRYHRRPAQVVINPHIFSLASKQSSFPVPESTSTTSFSILPTPAPRLVPPTETERVEAVRVLAAGNALVGLLMLGIMGMQVGQEYAKRVEEREQREVDKRTVDAAAAGAGVKESKKDL